MTLSDFIEMLGAIKDERPFKVGYQLQSGRSGKLSIQEFVSSYGADKLITFLQQIEDAEPPDYE